jgi:hypothetical protein
LKVGRLQGMNVLHVRRPGGETLALFVAGRYTQRLCGLAGLRALPLGTGLLIPDCRSVHTFGMRFAIDVLFVTLEDRSLQVHDARVAVAPGRVVRASRMARARPDVAALELPAGLGLGESAGARLQPQDSAQPVGQVPVPVPDQLHRRGDEHRPDDRRVEQDRG